MRRLSALSSLSPSAPVAKPEQIRQLVEHIRGARRLLCVTGAGLSTTSGIPDYRSPNGSYSRGHKPIQHAEFVKSEANRRRYWSRSFVGWRYFSRAEPNAAHHALAALEMHGHLAGGLITQNVDGLHSAAGHQHVLDLHGRIDTVECLACEQRTERATLQQRLAEANAAWVDSLGPVLPNEVRADGDSEIDAAAADALIIPSCEACGGVLKPGVTFFGGSVPPQTTKAAADAVASADALLVLGTSMQVFSAYRIARAAAQASLPIAIVTNGETRADDLASLRVAADVCEVLPRVLEQL